ncbi:NAD(+)/NADH kinase [Candidatus Micrarchaeota archaeon]|nr:NAD(+)/NADH kinase [Candidatus Micrarchaeota archaeon]MBU1930836.1 NAD(+)/NADH kinase [Candidatus Micrarchaeota archaeon]
MKVPKTIGIALSKRETAKLVFKQCQRVFQKKKVKLNLALNLTWTVLKTNKPFLQSDIIICFGGDGSFLRVCQAIQTKTPLFLVGTGERNYLSCITASEAPKKIEEILNGQYYTKKRTRLSSGLPRQPFALNEIAITPAQSATILHYELAIENQTIWHDYSDGILICTPTGSSAYFAAAGGPRLDVDAPIVGIASLNSIEERKKMVSSNQKKVVVKKMGSASPIEAIIDGQQRVTITKELEISLAKKPVWLGFPLEKKVLKPLRMIDLTPSARLVWQLLQSQGASTQQELINQSGLHARSIRRALKDLLIQKKVVKRPYSKDNRQDLYHPV